MKAVSDKDLWPLPEHPLDDPRDSIIEARRKAINNRQLITVVLSTACVCVLSSVLICFAADPAESGHPILDRLLKSVEANDYESFVADGADAFKAAMTKQMLQGVSGQLAPRMQKGYECSYLGELKQHGLRVMLWKVSFKDGGDDILAKLVVQDGKVAGFWLQ